MEGRGGKGGRGREGKEGGEGWQTLSAAATFVLHQISVAGALCVQLWLADRCWSATCESTAPRSGAPGD